MVTASELRQTKNPLVARQQRRAAAENERRRVQWEYEQTPEYQQMVQKKAEQEYIAAETAKAKTEVETRLANVKQQIEDTIKFREQLRSGGLIGNEIDYYNNAEEQLIRLNELKGTYEGSIAAGNYAQGIASAENVQNWWSAARDRQEAKRDYLQRVGGAFADGTQDIVVPGSYQYEKITEATQNKYAYENQLLGYAQNKGYENVSPAIQQQLQKRGLVTMSTGYVDSYGQSMSVNPFYTTTKYNPKADWNYSVKLSEERWKSIQPDLERYRKSGYSEEESRRLAGFSTTYGFTPTKETAFNIGLIKSSPSWTNQSWKEFIQKRIIKNPSAFWQTPDTLSAAFQKGYTDMLGKTKLKGTKVQQFFVKPQYAEQNPKWYVAKNIATGIAMGSFFSPVMKTGTEYTDESADTTLQFIKKRRKGMLQQVQEARPEASLDDYTIKFEKAYLEEGSEGVKKLLQKYQNIIKSQENPANKELAIENMNKILQVLYNRGIVKAYVIDEAGNLNVAITPVIKSKLWTEPIKKPKKNIFVPSTVTEVNKPFTIQSQGGVTATTVTTQEPIIAFASGTLPGEMVYAASITGSFYRTKLKSEVFTPQKTDLFLSTLSKTKQDTQQKTISLLGSLSAISTLQTPLSITKQQTQQQTRQDTRQDLIQTPVTITDTITKLREQQKSKFRTGLRTRLNTDTFTPIKPTYNKPPVPPISLGNLKSVLSKIGKGTKAYEVQIRRRGQFATIAKGLPIGKAKQLLAKRVMGSLAQTGRLFEKGTTTSSDISYNLPSNIFTRLKKPTTELEWVERRGQTLKRGYGEIGEIMSARRIKGRRKFL